MTRISDLAIQTTLMQNYQRVLSEAQDRQVQLSSGKVATAHSALGPAAHRLISAEGVVTRASAYQQASSVALSRLGAQAAAMENVGDALSTLRARITSTLATGSAETLRPETETAAQRILSSLNSHLGGVYLFGGDEGDAPPVSVRSLDALAALDDADEAFVRVGARTRLPVEEGVTVDGGPNAREFAGGALKLLHDFAAADAALGPFSGNLTADQRAFLVDMVAEIDRLSAGVHQALGINGVAQSQAEAARLRNVERRDLAEVLIASIEDVDIAEAVSRLARDQLALEASARALATATQLSLLNFL